MFTFSFFFFFNYGSNFTLIKLLMITWPSLLSGLHEGSHQRPCPSSRSIISPILAQPSANISLFNHGNSPFRVLVYRHVRSGALHRIAHFATSICEELKQRNKTVLFSSSCFITRSSMQSILLLQFMPSFLIAFSGCHGELHNFNDE